MAHTIDPEQVIVTDMADGQSVQLMYVQTWDGLYAPIGMRKPEGDGPFPVVLLASGKLYRRSQARRVAIEILVMRVTTPIL